MKPILFAVLALLATATYATGTVEPPKPPPAAPPVVTSSEASAQAAAAARAAAAAQAAASARQAQVANATAAGGQGVGNVEVAGDDVDYRARALALALPSLVAAPAVAGDCLVHTRGGGGLSIGVTGSTKLDPDCMAKRHCLAIADRFAAWGQFDAAAQQLQSCGGVPFTPVPPTPEKEPCDDCREQVERVWKQCNKK